MRTKAAAAAAALVAALALAACGGGSDNSSSSSSADVKAFCDKAKEFQQLRSSFGNLSSVSEARSAFQQSVVKMQAVDDAAPSDIKDSADQVLKIFKDVSAAASGASTPQQLQSKLQGVSSELNDLGSPLNDLKSFYRDNCTSS